MRHLALEEYDLGGYSLGARTAARMLVRGARARRAVIAGMGLDGLLATSGRADFFRAVLRGAGTHARGSPEWMAEAFLKTTGGDAAALLPLLDSFVDTAPDELERIAIPVLALCGIEDRDNGSAADLVALLPRGTLVDVPGTHMSAVLQPALGRSIAEFFGEVTGR